jgi:hypothetical protein
MAWMAIFVNTNIPKALRLSECHSALACAGGGGRPGFCRREQDNLATDETRIKHGFAKSFVKSEMQTVQLYAARIDVCRRATMPAVFSREHEERVDPQITQINTDSLGTAVRNLRNSV